MQTPDAPNLFFHSPQQRVALARERFFDEVQRPRGLVSDAVIASWERSLKHGLSPHQRPDFEPVNRAKAARAVDRSQTLLLAASPECAQLEAALAGTRCRAMLTDAEGILVLASRCTTFGGPILEAASRVGVYLGEDNFGSTAPGIVIRTAEACTVDGGEHFFGMLGPMYCAAAPLRDHHGQLAGALNLSIEGQPFGFDALALVRLTALAIENRLFAMQSVRHWLLRLQMAPQLLDSPLQGLLALQDDGRVVAMNAAARQILQPVQDPATWHSEALLGASFGQLRDLLASGQPRPQRLPAGLQIWLQTGWAHRAVPLAEPPLVAAATPAAEALTDDPPAGGSLRSVSDALIAETLRQHDGNISAAARALGVSRGLLYRRLRPKA